MSFLAELSLTSIPCLYETKNIYQCQLTTSTTRGSQFAKDPMMSSTFVTTSMIPPKPSTSLGLVAQFSRSTRYSQRHGHACIHGHHSQAAGQEAENHRKTHAKRMIKRDQNKNDISERNLSLQDKIMFHQAKAKELKSFFENGVLSFQTTREAVPDRTFTSRILLKWAKNADGTPRAKARLGCQRIHRR